MSFIRALMSAGLLLRHFDLRTGSVYDFAQPLSSPPIVGTPRFQNSGHGLAMRFGTVLGGAYIDIPGTGLASSPGIPTLQFMTITGYTRPFVGSSFFTASGTTAGTRQQLYISGANLYAYDGTAASASTAAKNLLNAGRVRSVGGMFGGGVTSDFFLDGTRFAGTASTTCTSDPVYVRPGYLMPSENMLMETFTILRMDGITDADIARLHRELVAGPSVVRRPRKGFSIPYPAKTPAQYAAEGITLDTTLVPQQSKAIALVGTDGALASAQYDVVRDGPFSEATRYVNGYANFGTAQGDPSPGTGSFAFVQWIRFDAAPSGQNYFASKYAGIPLWSVNINSSRQITARARNAIGDVSTASVQTYTPKWLCVGYRLNRATNRLALFFDGISVSDVDASVLGAGTMANLNTLQIGKSGITGVGLNGALGPFSFFNRDLSPAEFRAEYLKGATKCLLDARVHSDGSCPVSLAAVGAGNEIANGWQVAGDTWKVVEDAPSNGTPGKRYLQSAGAHGIVWRRGDNAPYGAWLFELSHASGQTTYLNFASDRIGGTNVPAGYALVLSVTTLILRRNIGGGHVNIFTTAAGTFAYGTWYKFWVTRRVDGQFNVWAKGGAYADWTLVPVATGSNPVTDTTYTQSLPYVVNDSGVGNGMSQVVHLLSEMTPYEAMRRGKLKGNIPEPFWEVTTSTTSVSWTVGLLANADFVIEWGDGTATWGKPGSVTAYAHTYASSGTYTIRFYSAETSKIYRFQSNGVVLTGTFPVALANSPLTYFGLRSGGAGMTGEVSNFPNANLIEYLVEANGFTGTIPPLSQHTGLMFAWFQTNHFTGYTASTLAPTLTSLQAQGNDLTLDAVNQILIDFTTGAAGRPAAGTINLSGGTNAVPTPAIKAACVAALPGWTITTN